jgi:YVTN family beta-propeller protein
MAPQNQGETDSGLPHLPFALVRVDVGSNCFIQPAMLGLEHPENIIPSESLKASRRPWVPMVRFCLFMWFSGALVPIAALDSSPNNFTVKVNGGARSTYSPWVVVSFNATNSETATDYFLSEAASSPLPDARGWTPVEPSSSRTWNAGFTLSPGHGVKTVYAWLRNSGGAVSGAESGSILLAPTPMDNVHIVSLRPDGKELYVGAGDTLTILVVDMTSTARPVVAAIQPPWVQSSHPADTMYDIAFSPDGSRAYVPRPLEPEYSDCQNCPWLHGILVIDTSNHLIASILTVPLGDGEPNGSAVVSRDGKYLFMTLNTSAGEMVGKYDLMSQRLIARIALPGAGCVRLSPDGSRLHVSRGRRNGATPPPNLFSVVDADRMELIASVPTGVSPLESVASTDGRKAWVANFRSNDVTAIDLAAIQRIATIPAGANPRSLALTADGRKLYTGNTGLEGNVFSSGSGNSLTVIDAEHDVALKTVSTGLEPQTVAMDAARGRVYVSDGNANGLNPARVHVFDTATDSEIDQIILRGSAHHAPTALDVSPDGTTAYVIAEAAASLMAVRIPSGDVVAASHCYPRAVKLSRDGARVFVFSPQYPPGGDGRLFILDAASLALRENIVLGRISTLHLGDQLAFHIVIDSREETAYLTLPEQDEVLVVDLRQKRLTTRIALSSNAQPSNIPPNGLALTPDGTRLFATSCRGGSVTAIDTGTNTVTGVALVGQCPAAVRITPDGRRAYVLQHTSMKPITVLDVQSLAITRTLSGDSVGAALDFILSPDEHYAYISVFDPNHLAIYDLGDVAPQDRKTRIIRTGIDPFRLTANGDSSLIYGVAYTSDEIFVASTATNSILHTVPLRLLAPAELDQVTVYRRIFPKVHLNAPTWSSGLAVLNLSPSPAVLQFKLYSNVGEMLGSSQRTLEPKTQMACLVSELFTGVKGDAGWLLMESSVPDVEGFFLLFDDAVTSMDGAGVTGRTYRDFVLPVTEGADVSLVNPGNAPVDYTISYISDAGIPLGAVQGTIPALGRKQIQSDDVRPAGSSGGYLRGSSGGVVPLEVFGNVNWIAALEATNASPATSVTTHYAPQFVAGGGYLSTLDLINLEASPSTLTLTWFGDLGQQLGQSATVLLPAAGSTHLTGPAIFGLESQELTQGYLCIQSTGASFAGSVRFADVQQRAFSSALNLNSTSLTDSHFSQVAQNSQYYTGLAAINRGTGTAAVTVTVYDTSGRQIASGGIQIAPGGRFSKLLSELVGTLPEMSKGYFRVSSNEPLVSFALFGTSNGGVLSAIPAQFPTGR